MMGRFEEQVNMLEERLACLEPDARQPRLAMEADGRADMKTRERTEGAATTVQAIHRNSWTAQKVQEGPNLPISLAGKKFWSRAAMLRPSRVSHPWRCAHQQPLVA